MPNGNIPGANEPVPGPAAFQRDDKAALLSQAATLLVLGAQMRGDASLLLARAAESKQWVDAFPDEDVAVLGIPRLEKSPGVIDVQRKRRFLSQRYDQLFSEELAAPAAPPLPLDVVTDVAGRFFQQPTTENADDLIESCLRHPHELVRTAAAVAFLDRSPERSRLAGVLERGAQSEDELVRELAATGLARLAPEHAILRRLQSKGRGFTAGAAGHSLLVHGTWALNSSWWQPPDGDFYRYLLGDVFPDLYGAPDVFFWSGGYSNQARELAAGELVTWVSNRNLQGLNVIAHSHGGNVAMRATRLNSALSVGKLVLLSCPVHFPQYLPDFGKITRAVSIRVHLDLVILADRGGQRFRHPSISENVLPIWFDHTATHSPDAWQQHDVRAML